MGALETAAERGWKRLDPRLRWLAIQAAAGEIGCSWCTDFGYYEGMQQGIDPRKVRDVPRFGDSDVYDETERVVLDYAVAATATPVAIADELVERLHRHLSEPEIVELAAWVALENFRSRFNAGLGLKSQELLRPVRGDPSPPGLRWGTSRHSSGSGRRSSGWPTACWERHRGRRHRPGGLRAVEPSVTTGTSTCPRRF